jgi:O-antigen/teichoic acid export membrane protein
VLAYLSADLVRVVASYVIHPYRPRFRLRIHKVRELFDFGKWILGAGAVAFFLNRGDKGLVGKLLGATTLGFYEIAYKISNLTASEIALVISEVTMPAYSRLQERIGKMRDGYLRVLQLTAFFSIPLAGSIVLLAPELTRFLIGDKWQTAVPAMRMLAPAGALRSIIATAGPVYMAVGRPRIITKLQLCHLIILGVLIYPMTRYMGIAGTAAAVTLAAVVPAGLFVRGVLGMLECSAAHPARLLAFPTGATLLACVPVLALKWFGAVSGNPALDFILPAAAFAATYLCVIRLLGRFCGYRLAPLFKEMLNALRSRR